MAKFKSKVIAEAGVQISTATPGTVLVFDVSGNVISSSVTSTELTQLSGVTAPVITTTSAQTLENKTLTSPIINSPTGITKSDVGLSNVDNTSDANKLVSTAQQTALNLKAPLESPTFTGTVSGIDKTMVGLSNVDNTSDATKNSAISTLTNKTLTSPIINSPTGIVKADVGLSNVDNTSDVNKPVSTAQQNALNLKADLASPTFTGTVSGITKSMVGLSNVDNTSDATKNAAAVTLTNKTITSPLGLVKADVGLSNVDNTSDVNKPVSTAQQTALNLKADLASPTFTGTLTANDYAFSDTNFNTISLKQQLADIDSTGVTDGLILSIGTPNTTFSLSAGSVNFSINIGTASVKNITLAAQNNQTLTFLNTNTATYIGINSSGTIVQQVTQFTNTQRRTIAIIGVAGHTNLTIVNAVGQNQNVIISPGAQVKDLEAAIGFFNISGNIFSANGVNLNINKSFGTAYKTGSNWGINQSDPNQTTLPAQVALPFQYRFQNDTSLASSTNINPNIYDLSGVSTAVPGNRFTIQRIYALVIPGQIRIQPGQVLYTSLSNAVSSVQTEVFIQAPTIVENGLLRGFLIVQGGTTDLTNTTRTLFLEAPKFGGTGGIGSISTATLQSAYNNSITPEIITNSTLGALSIQRGSIADTDNVLEVQNGVGTTTFSVTGAGIVTSTNLVTVVTGDIVPTSFSAANNQVTAANVTGFAFAAGTVRSFQALVSVSINATTPLNEVFELMGIQLDGGFNMIVTSNGNDSGIVFSITSAGQVTYTSGNSSGFVTNKIVFRAISTNV